MGDSPEDRLELDRRNFLGLLGGSAIAGLPSTTKLDSALFSPQDARQSKLLGKFRYNFFIGSKIGVLSSGWTGKRTENALGVSLGEKLLVNIYNTNGRKFLIIQTEQFDEIGHLPRYDSDFPAIERIIDDAYGKYSLFGVIDSIVDDDLGEAGILRTLVIGIYADFAG